MGSEWWARREGGDDDDGDNHHVVAVRDITREEVVVTWDSTRTVQGLSIDGVWCMVEVAGKDGFVRSIKHPDRKTRQRVTVRDLNIKTTVLTLTIVMLSSCAVRGEIHDICVSVQAQAAPPLMSQLLHPQQGQRQQQQQQHGQPSPPVMPGSLAGLAAAMGIGSTAGIKADERDAQALAGSGGGLGGLMGMMGMMGASGSSSSSVDFDRVQELLKDTKLTPQASRLLSMTQQGASPIQHQQQQASSTQQQQQQQAISRQQQASSSQQQQHNHSASEATVAARDDSQAKLHHGNGSTGQLQAMLQTIIDNQNKQTVMTVASVRLWRGIRGHTHTHTHTHTHRVRGMHQFWDSCD